MFLQGCGSQLPFLSSSRFLSVLKDLLKANCFGYMCHRMLVTSTKNFNFMMQLYCTVQTQVLKKYQRKNTHNTLKIHKKSANFLSTKNKCVIGKIKLDIYRYT